MTAPSNEQGFAVTEPPLVVGSAGDIAWGDTADIIVVGFGGAGVATALTAREQGLDVLVVDRFGGGGATRWSGGVIYAGATRFQRDAGYEDNAGQMYEYLSLEANPVKPETLRRFCEESNDNLEWLIEQGVPYAADYFGLKTVYPPEGYYLYYTGNEKMPSMARHAMPAPRGHRAVGTGFTGYVYYDALKSAALAKGVRTLLHSPVRRLVTDGSGAVIGVETSEIPEGEWPEHDKLAGAINPMKPMNGERSERGIAACRAFESRFTGRKLVRARGGVVLATGGFVYNLGKLRNANPVLADAYKSMMRLGSMGCDGSGMDLGCSVGGETDLMGNFFCARSLAPPTAAVKGLLVNRDGRRFIAEDAYTGFLGNAISREPGGKAWLVMDSPTFKATFKQAAFPGKGLYLYTLPTLANILLGGMKRAGSIEKLARKCGMDPQVLKQSVDTANAAVTTGEDPFGKIPENMAAMEKASFYALNMDLSNKFTVTMLFSLGGLKVNEETGAVKNGEGGDIPGLYAAGRVAIGLNSINNISGMTIADTVFSGRRAARSIVARVNGAPAD